MTEGLEIKLYIYIYNIYIYNLLLLFLFLIYWIVSHFLYKWRNGREGDRQANRQTVRDKERGKTKKAPKTTKHLRPCIHLTESPSV